MINDEIKWKYIHYLLASKQVDRCRDLSLQACNLSLRISQFKQIPTDLLLLLLGLCHYRLCKGFINGFIQGVDIGARGGGPGGGVLHYGVRRGCAQVLGSLWPENSGIGIYFYLKISVIGVYFHLEFFREWGLLLYSKFWLWVLNESTTGQFFEQHVVNFK